MSKGNLFLQITNSIWLIEPTAIDGFLPFVKNIFEKNPDAFQTEIKTASAQIYDVRAAAMMPGRSSSFDNAPEGSIAIINVQGVLIPDDNCGDPGTNSLAQLTQDADNNPNIAAIVFIGNTPGGSVDGTENFSNTIKTATKPTVGVVTGMTCSAGYWILSACDELYVANDTSMVGSIGSLMSFADKQPALEKMGIVFHEIYADDSSDKNAESLAARKGNYDLMKKNLLNPINKVFTKAVTANRGDKLDQDQTLSGKVFLGKKAASVGLVDGKKSVPEAIDRANQLAKKSTKNNPPMKANSRFTAFIAAVTTFFSDFKAEDNITDAHLEKVNGLLETQAASITEFKTAKETADAALVVANGKVTTAEAEITRLKTENETLAKANPGAVNTIADAQKEDKPVAEWQKVMAALPHNKAVDSNPIFQKVEKIADK